MKSLFIATVVSAATMCSAAAEPPAGASRLGILKLTDSQLDAVTAGVTGSVTAAAATATGTLLTLTQTDTRSAANAAFLGDEIRGSSATGVSTAVAWGVGQGSGRDTQAQAATTAEGNVMEFSTQGAFVGRYLEISYAASASFGSMGFLPVLSP